MHPFTSSNISTPGQTHLTRSSSPLAAFQAQSWARPTTLERLRSQPHGVSIRGSGTTRRARSPQPGHPHSPQQQQTPTRARDHAAPRSHDPIESRDSLRASCSRGVTSFEHGNPAPAPTFLREHEIVEEQNGQGCLRCGASSALFPSGMPQRPRDVSDGIHLEQRSREAPREPWARVGKALSTTAPQRVVARNNADSAVSNSKHPGHPRFHGFPPHPPCRSLLENFTVDPWLFQTRFDFDNAPVMSPNRGILLLLRARNKNALAQSKSGTTRIKLTLDAGRRNDYHRPRG